MHSAFQPKPIRFTKSDFLDFRACAKSLWLSKIKPAAIEWPAPSEHDRLLMQEGYAVEELVKQLVETWPNTEQCTFQRIFVTPEGLFARADLVRDPGDGPIDLWEIKSSTSVKSSTGDHVVDATFQTLVAKRSGVGVRSVGIAHVNKEYIRTGDIDPAALLTFADVTDEVRDRMPEVETEVEEALALLAKTEIDEGDCSCLFKSKSQHCASFVYFNPGVPTPSIYDLPRLSVNQRETFVPEGRYAPGEIDEAEVTALQLPVLSAFKTGEPVINLGGIKEFIEALEYPLYFYDYETFASAIPIAEGLKPHEQIPVQVSLHRLDVDGTLVHSDILTERPGAFEEIVEFLRHEIGDKGNLIAWNASFEKSCNTRLARLVPEYANFLQELNDQTRDLMDIFKKDYVHPDFGGSTSIKKVLPVLCPDLKYDQDSVHDGTGAIEAWNKLTSSDDESEKAVLRRALLDYCELDTLAMVEIFRVIQELVSGETA
jgi:Domain of unknown function(DUF2779)